MLIQDMRYGIRSFVLNPVFTAVIILVLAFGIGVNAGIYSVFRAVLLRSLPVPTPSQLRILKISDRNAEVSRFSYPILEEMRTSLLPSDSLAMMSWAVNFKIDLPGVGESEMQKGQLVSGSYFSTFGVRPALGRLLTPEDDGSGGASPVGVISYEYWITHFSRDAHVLGSKVLINGTPVIIVGVASPGFFGADIATRPAFWLPLGLQPTVHYGAHYSSQNASVAAPWVPQTRMRWLQAILRVGDPSTIPAITTRLNTIFEQDRTLLLTSAGSTSERIVIQKQRIELVPGMQGFRRLQQQLAQPLFLLQAIAAVLLLIACANIANILLVRASARQREIAVRISLGATRARIIRQMLTESLLLAWSGGAGAILVAIVCGRVLPQWIARGTSSLIIPALGDWKVLVFGLGVCSLTGVIFGVAPALQGARVQPATALKTNARNVQGTGGKGRWSITKLLVICQVGLSLIVLVIAGIFLRTLLRYNELNPGFDRDHTLIAFIDPRADGFAGTQATTLAHSAVLAVDSLAGVTSAALSSNSITGGDEEFSNFWIDVPGVSGTQNIRTQITSVTPSYFSTVGIPLLRGRFFSDADNANGGQVVIVNRAFVQRFLAGKDALNVRVGAEGGDSSSWEIVGVVGDARVNGVQDLPPPMAYFAVDQTQSDLESLFVKTNGDPHALVSGVRTTLSRLGIPPSGILTVKESIEEDLAQEYAVSNLSAVFGLFALVLASAGLYGIMAYNVVRRRSEIGVRLALGSTRANVLSLVLREAFVIIGIGIVLGVGASVVICHITYNVLYGITAYDPITAMAVALILLVVGGCAATIPAWQASKIDPVLALRE
jgi:macrolide transport system ATP-binding/permease protein